MKNVEEKIRNVKGKVMSSEFVDGIREVAIGIIMILGALFMGSFSNSPFRSLIPIFSWISVFIIVRLVDYIRTNTTKKYIGQYKYKTNITTYEIIKGFMIATVLIPIIILSSLSFLGADFKEAFNEPYIVQNCINLEQTCRVTNEVNIQPYANILLIAGAITLVTSITIFEIWQYKYFEIKRFKFLAIYSLITGAILLGMYIYNENFIFGKNYLLLIGLSYLVSGVTGYLQFRKEFMIK